MGYYHPSFADENLKQRGGVVQSRPVWEWPSQDINPGSIPQDRDLNQQAPLAPQPTLSWNTGLGSGQPASS